MFAGEDIECTITFKNVTPPEGRDGSPVRRQNGFAKGGERQRKLPPVHSSTRPSVSRNSSFTSQLPPSNLRGHRPVLSLHTPSTAGGRRSPVPPGVTHANNTGTAKHGRSVSIVSLGTDVGTEVSHDRGIPTRRPARGHGRSASLQVVPGRPNSYPSRKDTRDLRLWLTWQQLLHQAIDQLHIPLHYPAKPRLRQPTTPATLPFPPVRTGDGLVLLPPRAPQLCRLQGGNPPTPSRQTSSSQLPLCPTMLPSRSQVAALQSHRYTYGAPPRSRHMTIFAYQGAPISRCFRLLHG